MAEAWVREKEAGARIETAKSRGFAAGVALAVVLALVGIGSAVLTGSGIEYGGGVAAGATLGLTLLLRLGRR